MRRKLTIVISLLLIAKIFCGQPCTNTGQSPSSAILLCGSGSYIQNTVPFCGQTAIPVPCAATADYQNTNPFWFRLNCFSTGTLGFTITPNDLNDNYDWQVFDISGRNDDDVFTDPSLFLGCNWCAEPGETGASIDGANLSVCTGTSTEVFSKMPGIILGHEYLLMVSHRNATESGFQITISGGTGSVTDPSDPGLLSARLSCNSNQITVLLNKKMFCSTIAPDGSDFDLSSGAAITSAIISDCTNDETHIVTLLLSNTIVPGNYTLSIKNGTDGNTIMDKCNRYITPGEHVTLIMPSPEPTLMDSLKTPGCSPAILQLAFHKPVQCNSIAADGSDFTITGPQAVTVNNVTTSCTMTGAFFIDVHLSAPLATGGSYQIKLNTGSDGNTIIDECGSELSPASLSFTIKDTVSASFTHSIKASCREDTIYFLHDGRNGVTEWNWNFDNASSPGLPNPVKIYPATGQHSVQLTVSNGMCTDIATQNIILDNKVTAAFEAPGIICPEDVVHFINKSTGTVDRWEWSFGNGVTSNLAAPGLYHYPVTGRELFYTIKLIASNITMNCRDSSLQRVKILGNCYIAVPAAFTPNGDGLNDYLQPMNALKADNLLFRVYNRVGQLVFETRDWTRKWDGSVKGTLQHTGVYAWILSFTHRDTGEKIFMKGTTVLIR
jgi:gliding motility-associated-like protein